MQGKGDGDQGVVGDLFGKGGGKEKGAYQDLNHMIEWGYADLGLGMQGVDHAGNPTQAREWGHLPYVLIPDEVSVALEREEKESDGLYYRPEIGKLNILYPLGWAKNTSGHYKKQKKDLLDKLDDLDKKAELAQILRDEEMKIFQLKDGALKKHITAYYKFRIYPKTFIKEIYPSIVLILCRDAEIIQHL
ncbi:hypothetical protein ACJX0J_029369 [Zea mays]